MSSPSRAFLTGWMDRRPGPDVLWWSDTEVVQELVLALHRLAVGELLDDPALRDEVVPVGQRGGEAQVLLDEQDRDAVRLDPGEDLADLLDQQRGQSLGWLVAQQHPRTHP